MNKGGSFPREWMVVGASFITLALVYSIWYSFSVFFVTLLKEFGWSRSIGAGAFSLFCIIGGFIGPFVGMLIPVLGAPKVILLGALILGGGLALCSLSSAWWQFYLFFGVVAAAGVGAAGWIPNVTLVQSWFKEKRGLATGIVSSGIGIGILIFVPLIQILILRVGWRMTYCLMAVFVPSAVIGMVLTCFRVPPPGKAVSSRDRENLERGTGDPLVVDHQWVSCSWTFQQASHTKQFWLLGLSFFLGNFMTQSIFTHQVAFFVDQGLEAVFASYLVGLMGIISLGGKIFWGTLSDRIGREMTYTAGVVCFIGGMLLLILFNAFPSKNLTYLYSINFALGYSVTAALPPLITADLFEGPAFGSIFGAVMVFTGVGGALGAWFAGVVFDWTGSYVIAFILMIACSIVSCLCIWKAGPRKIRMVPGKAVR